MTLQDATKLLNGSILRNNKPQTWADLGAGTGTFTNALSTFLTNGSTIYAIDQNPTSLAEIRIQNKNVKLITQSKDFQTGISDLPFLDGIVMANSLHYVEEQDVFLSQIRERLKPDGVIVVVEYERKSSNEWVPFPVPYNHLVRMAEHTDFREVRKLNEHPSVFEKITIYCAVLKN
jgi:ubiquinone/menaquinone biosynthesis C-methylase UbiE